jgi:uncharacterized membrane protein
LAGGAYDCAELWDSLAGAANSDMDKIIPVVLTLVGVMVLALLGRMAISRYRKKLVKGFDETSEAWSLEDLREMRDSGQLTDEEYQALRQRMIRKAAGAMGGGKAEPNSPADSNDKMSR